MLLNLPGPEVALTDVVVVLLNLPGPEAALTDIVVVLGVPVGRAREKQQLYVTMPVVLAKCSTYILISPIKSMRTAARTVATADRHKNRELIEPIIILLRPSTMPAEARYNCLKPEQNQWFEQDVSRDAVCPESGTIVEQKPTFA